MNCASVDKVRPLGLHQQNQMAEPGTSHDSIDNYRNNKLWHPSGKLSHGSRPSRKHQVHAELTLRGGDYPRVHLTTKPKNEIRHSNDNNFFRAQSVNQKTDLLNYLAFVRTYLRPIQDH